MNRDNYKITPQPTLQTIGSPKTKPIEIPKNTTSLIVMMKWTGDWGEWWQSFTIPESPPKEFKLWHQMYPILFKKIFSMEILRVVLEYSIITLILILGLLTIKWPFDWEENLNLSPVYTYTWTDWLLAILMMLILNFTIYFMSQEYCWDTHNLVGRLNRLIPKMAEEDKIFAESLLDDLQYLDLFWDRTVDSPYIQGSVGSQLYDIIEHKIWNFEQLLLTGNQPGTWDEWAFIHVQGEEIKTFLLNQTSPDVWHYGWDLISTSIMDLC